MIVNAADDAAAERIIFEIVQDPVRLVEHSFLVTALDADLIAVSLTDGTVLISPLIPDVRFQIMNIVGFALPDPQNLIHAAL
jgi:hypothetical protein